MVWHAYLLNPMCVDKTGHRVVRLLILLVSWYAEDTIRVPVLSGLPQHTEYLTSHLASSPHHSQWSFLIEFVAGISRASAHKLPTPRSSAFLVGPNDDTI